MIRIGIVLASLLVPPYLAYAGDDVGELAGVAAQADWANAPKYSIEIHAPVKKVWNYLSKNSYATGWSIFFDHITTLPGPAEGTLGSIRRCFRNKDEKGFSWDETTIESHPYTMRRLSVYNFQGLRYGFLKTRPRPTTLVTQVYEKINAQTTRLSFVTQISPEGNLAERIKFKLAIPLSINIFRENLENIAAAIEGRPRVHQYVPYPIDTTEHLFTVRD